jgi:microcystin degradation protein MlrC
VNPRVLLAGLFHETHTFVEERTPLEAFQILRGDELLQTGDDASPLGAAVAAGREFGWTWMPAIDVRTSPSGTADDAVVEAFWSGVKETIARESSPPDAVFLVLHGAMVSASFADVEGEVLGRLRSAPGFAELPIFGVFDLHASFSPAMAALSDCLTPYRENPHADAAESARRAAALLDRCLRGGERPRQFAEHARIVWPPSGTGTADAPLRELEAAARAVEAADPEVWDVGVVGGFAFADTPDTGVSFTITTTGSEAAARRHLDELCRLAWSLRREGNQIPPPLDVVMRRLRDEPVPGLTVIAEPADNIGGGAPGDCTELVRAFVEHRVSGALACLNDPQAVAKLADMNVGERVTLPLGGHGSRLDPGPIVLDVELVSRGDGRFTLEDRHSHLASMCGMSFDMGPCAVVRHEGLTLLLTSHKTPPFDLGQWRSQGIEPTGFSVVGVKAAVAHRRVYEPIAARMWSVDTAGPCTSDLRRFAYHRLRRPVYPLDDDL